MITETNSEPLTFVYTMISFFYINCLLLFVNLGRIKAGGAIKGHKESFASIVYIHY